MSETPTSSLEQVGRLADAIRSEVAKAVVGQTGTIDALLVALFAQGHVLLEGPPGTAKTFLAQCFAATLGLDFGRIQFTPDLMPGDILGSNLFNFQTSQFTLTRGPIFCDLLLADEINRTPPKTQAALLQAMQEREVSVGRKTLKLDRPFLVMATQNPLEQEGTYPLPEAQLDRFLFNVLLDYLSADEEVKVIERFTKSVEMPPVEACTNAEEIVQFQAMVRQVPISATLSRYAVDIVRATRPTDPIAPAIIKKYCNFGSSIRATMNLVLAAKVRALMEGRYHVTAEDLKKLAPPILRHRVLPNYFAESDGISIDKILAEMLDSLPVPAAE